jgi:hypothetical protein
MPINDPMKCFSLYCARVQELRETQFIKEGAKIGLKLKWDKEQGVRIIEEPINMTNLKAFLVTFRQFFLEGEPVNIFRIYNLCQQHITNSS